MERSIHVLVRVKDREGTAGKQILPDRLDPEDITLIAERVVELLHEEKRL